MLKLSSVLRNPFSFLFARSSSEERVAAYVIREHERGRSLAGDPRRSVRAATACRRSSRRGCSTGPDIIRAIGQDTVASARDSLPTV